MDVTDEMVQELAENDVGALVELYRETVAERDEARKEIDRLGRVQDRLRARISEMSWEASGEGMGG